MSHAALLVRNAVRRLAVDLLQDLDASVGRLRTAERTDESGHGLLAVLEFPQTLALQHVVDQ